jgi:dihydrofolate reductase
MAIILVAVTEINNGIANALGELLFDLPKDMKRFKEITTGKTVVMGRKTWDSLPVKPLPKRKNYVLTTDDEFEVKGRTKVLHSIDEVLELGRKGDVYVIGGGQVYYQLMPYADKLMMTHVHVRDDSAKVFFPQITVEDWKIVKSTKHEADKKHKYSFAFTEYERNAGTKEERK